MIMLQLPKEFQEFNMSVRNDIESLAKNVRSLPTFDTMTRLAESFEPGPMDVICARGKRAFNHSGNKHFRGLIADNLEAYKKATTKIQKSVIVSGIVDAVRQASPDGGFVKEDNGRWFEVGDHNAREKIGQSFRDLLHYKYKSSTKAKKHRRKKLQAEMEGEQEVVKSAPAAKQSVPALAQSQAAGHQQIDSLFNEANKELFQQLSYARDSQTRASLVQSNSNIGQHQFVEEKFSRSLQDAAAPEPMYVPSMPLASAYSFPASRISTATTNESNRLFRNALVDSQAMPPLVGDVSRSIFDAPLTIEGMEPAQFFHHGPKDSSSEADHFARNNSLPRNNAAI